MHQCVWHVRVELKMFSGKSRESESQNQGRLTQLSQTKTYCSGSKNKNPECRGENNWQHAGKSKISLSDQKKAGTLPTLPWRLATCSRAGQSITAALEPPKSRRRQAELCAGPSESPERWVPALPSRGENLFRRDEERRAELSHALRRSFNSWIKENLSFYCVNSNYTNQSLKTCFRYFEIDCL